MTGVPLEGIFDLPTLLAAEAIATTVIGHGGNGDRTDAILRTIWIAVSVDRTIGGSDSLFGEGGDEIITGGPGNDTIDGGAGNDVIAGDNAWITRRQDAIGLRYRGLTQLTIYSPHDNGDGTLTYLPNITGPVANPTGHVDWNIHLFDNGTTDTSLYGNDNIAGGADSDMLFGQMGNDIIQGDGSVSILKQTLGTWDNPGHSVARAQTDGNDYVEGGPGNDLIFGGLGQDDLIGGNSSLYLPDGAPRPDGIDTIFGGSGQSTNPNDNGPTTTSGTDANGNRIDVPVPDLHAFDADVIVGDNGNIYQLVDTTTGQFYTYNYDTYAGKGSNTANVPTRIIPRAVTLLDYTPTGDAYYTACNPLWPAMCTQNVGTNTNIGGGDFLFGEGGNDIVYGETGSDRIFGGGGDDQLYGNSGSDWISGGTGDDGVLGDDGLLLMARNGAPEPLYGLAATTQTTLSTEEIGGGDGHNGTDFGITVNVTGRLNYTAIEQPFFIGANDIIYGGLGNDFLHGGVGDDAMSGAEALSNYYAYYFIPAGQPLVSFAAGRDPLAYLGSLAAYYTQNDPLGYNWTTGLFRYFDPAHPFAKIMIDPAKTIDFLLNFTSALAFDPLLADPVTGLSFDPVTHAQPILDDGQDVLFGDAGNDWLVGGTNQDVLFGGWGNDVLQADDNLDSTKVTTLGGQTVDYTGICNLAKSYSNDAHESSEVCGDLYDLQSHLTRMRASDITSSLDAIGETFAEGSGEEYTPDEAATLLRLLQFLKPNYSPLANDIVDPRGTNPTFADIAFGGAGYDILIANTASDRLLDWSDPVNAYYFPWEGHDEDVQIHDSHWDQADQFLLDLGLALGADPTRPEVSPWRWDGHDADFRNGEPFGELGLFTRWHDHEGDWWWNADGSDWWWNGHTGTWWQSHDDHGWWNEDHWGWWPWHGGENPGLDVEGSSDSGDEHGDGHHDPAHRPRLHRPEHAVRVHRPDRRVRARSLRRRELRLEPLLRPVGRLRVRRRGPPAPGS